MFKLIVIIIVIVTIHINLSKCQNNNKMITNNLQKESSLSEKRHEHLQTGDSNNVVSVDNNKKDKKPSIMERIGSMLMMVPLLMQILSLPGALASIKMSLLKSLFIGKLALIIMIYNLLISLRPKSSDVVVVNHQPNHPEHYDHYYSPYDDDDSGWVS